jgi:hypothetical protein
MKTSTSAAVPALCLASALFVTTHILAAPKDTDPLLPVGNLSAWPTFVQTGTHPTLTWDIQYPESVLDIIDIDESGTVTPNIDLCMTVRVLGASYQIGVDKKNKPIWGLVEAQVLASSPTTNGTWTRFFYDRQDMVKPSQAYHTQQVRAGAPVEFQARAHNGKSWLPFRTTSTASPNVVALVKGQTPPSTVPAFSQGNIETFLKPYLDSAGTLAIGPKDVIYLIELGQTNTASSGFDLQDIVLLATYDYCKNNNGHGNNIDGVDVSNPGQGGGGPNGEEDPSGTIDDEK